MIAENIFDNAFILHDQSDSGKSWFTALLSPDFIETFEHLGNPSIVDQVENNVVSIHRYFKPTGKMKHRDIREELFQNWAHLKNIFINQPIFLIRDYFGEVIGFYYVWLESLITSLVVPTIIGFIFFIIGLTWSIQTNSNNSALTTFGDTFDNVLTPWFGVSDL